MKKGCRGRHKDLKRRNPRPLLDPSFSPKNLSAALDNADSPFLNRGLLSYNLGSIFKICVAAAALESGISPEEKYFCSGSVDCGNVFCCHKEDGHGEIDMSEAFAKSCNTYFINLAEKVGAESIFDFAQKAGLSADVVITEGLTAKSSLGQLSKIKESPRSPCKFRHRPGGYCGVAAAGVASRKCRGKRRRLFPSLSRFRL